MLLKGSIGRVEMRKKSKIKPKRAKIDISDTFGKLKRKISGQEFKDRARAGWQNA